MATVWERARELFRTRTNGLHWSILVMYFFSAFLSAFPMTALGVWLQADLNMSPSDQANFYASTFLPFTLKPLYGWISERFPIRSLRRKPYIVIANIVSTSTWFAAAWLVRSPIAAFGVMTLQFTALAFNDLLLGLLLVDCACKNMDHAAPLQAIAETTQSFASLLALFVGLPLYPCSSGPSPLEPTHVFLITGVIAAAACAFAYCLPDSPVQAIQERPSRATTDDESSLLLPLLPHHDTPLLASEPAESTWSLVSINQVPERLATAASQNMAPHAADRNGSPPARRPSHSPTSTLLAGAGTFNPASALDAAFPNAPRALEPSITSSLLKLLRPAHAHAQSQQFPALELAVPAVLLLLVWASVKSFLSHSAWLTMLYCVLAIDAVVFLFLWRATHSHCPSTTADASAGAPAAATAASQSDATVSAPMRALRMLLRTGAAVWPALVLLVYSAVPSAEDALSSYQYGVWIEQTCYPQYLSIATEAASLAVGLAFFFLFHNWHGTRIIALFAASGVLAAASNLLWWPWVTGTVAQPGSSAYFVYAVFAAVTQEAFYQMLLITSLVVATLASPRDYRSSFTYALYLSFLDIGDSVSGWVSAAITERLGITLADYAALPTLIWIAAGCLATAMLLAPLLFFAPIHGLPAKPAPS
jgi:hypothetical protein